VAGAETLQEVYNRAVAMRFEVVRLQ